MKFLGNSLAFKGGWLSHLENRTSLDSYLEFRVSLLIIRKLRYCLQLPFYYLRNRIRRMGPLRALAKFRDSWEGVEALVLGSGPSIELLRVEQVRMAMDRGGLKLVVCNNFFLTKLAHSLTPDLYLLRDIAYLKTPPSKGVWEWLRQNPEVALVTPHTWKRSLEAIEIPNKLLFFEDSVFPLVPRRVNPLALRSYMATSGVVSLAICNFFGPNKIYVLGLDLDPYRHAKEEYNVLQVETSYYAASVDLGDWKDDTYGKTKPLGLIDMLQASANQLYFLRRDFSRLGREVYNLNQHSVFGLFPIEASSEFTR